ncbi:MAG: alpha/beta hydrolase [Gammaproteobacteria bacterium]|nr:alpha/beta hydrolase [Gammaproteobacteria bacterium]
MELKVDDKVVYAATGNREFDPALPSVVFVHGAGMDHTVWVLPTRYFVRHKRNVLAIDLPGHGRSGGPLLTSIEEMGDWIIRVLDVAGLEQAAVVGHSMGSLAALEAAVRHPSRVRSLVMVGTSVPMPVTDALLDSSKANDHLALDMLNVWGHSRGAHIGGNATPGMWMMGGGIRLLERAAPGVVHTDLKACNEYADGLEHAKTVSCPALLILGERDMMAPPKAALELSHAIANAETVKFKGAGHALLSERPDPVLDQLIRMV